MAATFVLDANVLYSARLRDLWLQLASDGFAQVAWTDAIEAEWTTALGRARPDLQTLIARTTAVMRTHFPSAYISDGDLPPLNAKLPDPNDLHVVRAALGVDGVIVTFNMADFPPAVMTQLGVKVVTPDEAFAAIAATDEEALVVAATAIRQRLKAPPIDAEAFAAGYARAGCPVLAAWLERRLPRS